MVRSVGHISGDAALGQEFAPKEREPLLGEASQNSDNRGPREHRERELRLPDEFPDAPLLDRGHEVPVDKAVRDIEAVRPDEKHEDDSEHQFRSPADLRPREGSDGRDQPRRDSSVGRSLGLHTRLGEWAAN